MSLRYWFGLGLVIEKLSGLNVEGIGPCGLLELPSKLVLMGLREYLCRGYFKNGPLGPGYDKRPTLGYARVRTGCDSGYVPGGTGGTVGYDPRRDKNDIKNPVLNGYLRISRNVLRLLGQLLDLILFYILRMLVHRKGCILFFLFILVYDSRGSSFPCVRPTRFLTRPPAFH
ncbi:hypothetical protein CASFOL_028375 [Castilleja foliolosa]|uniref:Uncharacterized protein n=1 Tax=Castilleja foliolosa TaxID=1961234 RepID=A0ABD3CBU9_9LAMI